MAPTLPSLAVAAGAGIIASLGALHVCLTFVGEALHPRDPMLREAMGRVPVRLSARTTVWRAWIGFNASHGLGAMLFGALFLHLALSRPGMLRDSVFFAVLGAGYLVVMIALTWRCWFRTPFLGLLSAAVLHAAGMIGLHLQG